MGETRNINDTSEIPIGISTLDAQAAVVASNAEIIIITGMSGAGRSQAAATLEDIGWYVIDNLPPRLLTAVAGLIETSAANKLACVVDVRSRSFFTDLIDVIGQLRTQSISYRLIFLDASDAELVRRYENVRRPHPLQEGGRLLDGIAKERDILADLRTRADAVIDTTDMSVHDLARRIKELVGSSAEEAMLTVMSFGFKYGLPLDANYVADVRFLPNPYWVHELRHLTGKDAPVRDFVLGVDGAQSFADHYTELISSLIEGFKTQLKNNLTIAIGCTGGKHRSVALTEEISRQLRERGFHTRTIHRDLGRE
ncbi:MAG: RNase adapter RapZ [Actinomycetaceae bacterium]|nr:RNase adapter RapZ [Arcanobacterium sp.]MDD7505773.1 RNase adapter RapZ [Actinomycetaceae bacterium]MDY6143628.1 RNase adapter RapZ [Arcanobacterium sp.]